MQPLWLQSDLGLWRLLLLPLSLLCSKLDHLVPWRRPLLYSRMVLFDPFLHLPHFARIPWVLELLLFLYMRHLQFLSLLCLLAGPWVLEL